MATEIWSYLIVMSYTQLQNEMLPTFTYQVNNKVLNQAFLE